MIDWRTTTPMDPRPKALRVEAEEIWASAGFKPVDVREAIRRFNVGQAYRGLRAVDMYPGRGSAAGELDEVLRHVITLWPYVLGMPAASYLTAAGCDAWRASKSAVRSAVAAMRARFRQPAELETVLPRSSGCSFSYFDAASGDVTQ